MGSQNSDYLSWSDDVSPELYDTNLLLEDECDPNENETEEEDDELMTSSPKQVFSSGLSSSWSQPWPGNTDVCEGPLESQSPLRLDNKPSNWSPDKSAPVEANPSLFELPSQIDIPPVIGAGLANLGNTCFLNSVLQCFIHTVPLLHGVLLDRHSPNSYCKKEGFCILCALQDLVEYSFASKGRVVSPWVLVNNLSYISSDFHRFQQEDAHEFLQCFLDRLESCHHSQSKDEKSSEQDNLVKQVFGGCLVSKLKCCNCGHCSDTYESSVDLSLEIGDAENLVAALQSFTKVEKIEDTETKFTCEKCKEQVSVEKQLSFDQAPSVAVFHLKRFKNDGCLVEKIDKHVAFPLHLNLLPFTESGKKDEVELRYELYAVVVHIGLTSTSGHYYCFIRLSPKVWFKFDDSRVVLVSEDYVLSQSAYILFYAKEGTSWFSSYVDEAQKLFIDSFSISDTSPKSVLDNVRTSSVSPDLLNKVSYDSDNRSSDIGSEHKEFVNNEIENSGSVQKNKVERTESKDDNLHSTSASVARCPSDVSLPEAHKEVSPSVHKNVNRSEEVCVVASYQNANPPTPPRSPSPEIYREDPPDAGYSIPCGHLKIVDRISCKRRLEKDMDDFERKQACRFIRKSVPSGRGEQLLAAMRGSKSEPSVNRKKARKPGLHRDALRSLVAGTYR